MRACGNCRFFHSPLKHSDDPEKVEAHRKQAMAHGHDPGRGRCQRFPQEIAKHPDQWCGEFKPAFSQEDDDA